MRITELLDKRSISLNGAPKTKNEALDQVVELMVKSGKINDAGRIASRYMPEKKKARRVLERELRFHMANATLLPSRVLQLW